jgi:hypothetical protein
VPLNTGAPLLLATELDERLLEDDLDDMETLEDLDELMLDEDRDVLDDCEEEILDEERELDEFTYCNCQC